jgi:predicted glutamine amidotransferase
MCELMLINTNNRRINKTILYFLSKVDSIKNQDGFGFFTKNGGIFKTKQAPNKISNLSDIIDKNYSSGIILAHVRAASATNGSKIISDDKAHPFSTKKLILAHNGALNFTGNGDEYKDRGLIDSEEFLLELDKEYDGKNFPSAINKTMERFKGKFAFLIYSIPENKFYVIRGKTAKLYKSTIKINGEVCGIVINTSDSDLNEALMYVKDVMYITSKINIEFSSPEFIPNETINVLEGFNIVEVAKIKEDEPVSTYNYFLYNDYPCSKSYGYINNNTSTNKKDVRVNRFTELLYSFILVSASDFTDADMVCKCITGKYLLDLNSKDILLSHINTANKLINLAKGNAKLVRSWKTICSFSKTPYTDYKIQFPYVLEKPDKIYSIAEKLMPSQNKEK